MELGDTMGIEAYELADPSELITPCLLVYPRIIRSNLEQMIQIAGGVDRLRPHVKTHKTPQIVQMQLELGITKHKCATLREASMLAECEVPDVLIAYPQVGPAIHKLCELVVQYPGTKFSTVVDQFGPAQALSDAFESEGKTIDVLVDIDNGMHRTGIPAGQEAAQLYAFVAESSSLEAAGLHVYDGQNHQPSLAERKQAVASLMEPVTELLTKLVAAGYDVPKLVCGGTPTFPVFAEFELPDVGAVIECSPGTCVLSDYNYGKDYPDIMGVRHAAVLMTRVISKRAGTAQFTTDLGNKAVAADPPAGARCHFLNLPGAKELKQNEEHLIVATAEADRYEIGDIFYALPAHICPTVALHRYLQVVDQGKIVDCWEVTARDRLYR